MGQNKKYFCPMIIWVYFVLIFLFFTSWSCIFVLIMGQNKKYFCPMIFEDHSRLIYYYILHHGTNGTTLLEKNIE